MQEMALTEVIASAVEEFVEVGIPDPEVDAMLLAGHVLGLGRGEIAARLISGDVMTSQQIEFYERLVIRRATREPLQHITGRAPFRRLELAVGPGAFVPRPETELLVQIVVDATVACGHASPRVVDLGTGTGAIALAIATEVPHAEVWGVEASPEAFPWATRNNEALGSPIRLVAGDLTDGVALLGDAAGTFDVVVSNPPYIPDEAIPRDAEVRLFDPPVALFGGHDGLAVIRTIAGVAARLVRPGGLLALEHGELQGADVRAITHDAGWSQVMTHQDLTTRDRYTTAVWLAERRRPRA